MRRNYFIFGFLVLFLVLGYRVDTDAKTDLPKAPNWQFGWEGIDLVKKISPKVDWDNNPIYDNQKVLNSWGYKARNVDEIKDLIPEPLYNIMKHPELWGDFRINETAYIKRSGPLWERYLELTEKYKGQAYVDDAGSLKNYKAGIPFPEVDTQNDPKAAVKLVWNWHRRMRVDDDWSSDTCIDLIDRNGRHKYVVSERATLQYRGRLQIDPKPLYTPNPKNIDYTQYSVNKQPYNVGGTIARFNRYDLPNRNDDMWVYIPTMRRVRRMSTAERQDKMSGGKDFIWDSVETFDGAIGNYSFELVATKDVLQPLCCTNVVSDDSKGYLNCVDNYWQRRKTHIIKGVPKNPVNISAIYVYIDAETFRTNLGYVADSKGRPWLYQHYPSNALNSGAYGMHQSVAVDLITRHSSKNFTPSTLYLNGLTPADFDFEELKRRYLVR